MKLLNRGKGTSRHAEIQQSSTDWKSFKLTKRNIIPLLALDLAFIAGLSAIWITSSRRDGFELSDRRSVRVGSIEWQLSLTWTILPSFILQVFALWVATTIDALGFRQPFVELARGASAIKTVCLDYSSFWPLQREYKALRLGHWHLFGLLSLSLILKPTLGPLGAHMLAEGPYTRKILLDQDVTFTKGVTPSGDMGWNLPTVISLARAPADSSYGRWSNGNQTLLNFSIPSTSSTSTSRTTLIASTSAFYSTLNCSILQNLEEHLSFLTSNNTDNGRVFFMGSDPACNWTFNTAYSPASPTHLETFGTTRCLDSRGRLIIVSGTINSANSYNLSIISCVPLYWTSIVDLSFIVATNMDQTVQDWSEQSNSVKGLRPEWWNIFEDQLQQQLTSPYYSGDSNSAFEYTTPVGKIILDRIRAKSSNAVDPANLMAQATEVWANLYSLLLEKYMIRPAETRNHIVGYLTTTDDRLFVVKPITAAVLGLLSLIAVALVVVFTYTARHISILQEEPVGIQGYADLLADSCLTENVKEYRQRQDYNGRASRIFLTEHKKSASSTTFKMDDIDDFNKRRIVAVSAVTSDAQGFPLLDRSARQSTKVPRVES